MSDKLNRGEAPDEVKRYAADPDGYFDAEEYFSIADLIFSYESTHGSSFTLNSILVLLFENSIICMIRRSDNIRAYLPGT